MAVNDFASLLLGEAGGKTAAERYNDMLHIASVVVNRSNATGRPVSDIIANSREFNAWGKALPPGTSKYAGLAEQAIQQVLREGPVTNATFYATPAAKGNLPSGLSATTKTASHEYFTDPQNRAIGTANGYAQVSPINIEPVPAVPISAPVPFGPLDMRMEQFQPQYAGLVPPTVSPPAPSGREITPGRGLENLAPNGLAGIDYNMGPRRPDPPGKEIQGIVQSAVTDILGPDHRVSIISGRGEYGSNRHRGEVGRAMDFDILGPSGARVTDKQSLVDVAQAAMAKGAKGWGYGPEYMGPGRMHIDTVLPGPRQNHTWGSVGRANRDQMQEARDFALMPASFYQRSLPNEMAPPASRDQAMALPAVPAPAPNFAGGLSPRGAPDVPATPFAGAPAVPASLSTFDSPPPAMTIPGTLGAPMSVPPVSAPAAPSVPQNVIDAYQQYGASRAAAPATPVAPPSAPVPAVGVPATAPAPSSDLEGIPAIGPVPSSSPRNPAMDFARGALAGGLPGAALGPAISQIGRNARSKARGEDIGLFKGIPQAYRNAWQGLRSGFDGLFSSSPMAATPFSVGSGLGAIQSVMAGGLAPGATAHSVSHPGASWSVNDHGIPEFTSQHGFTGPVPSGF